VIIAHYRAYFKLLLGTLLVLIYNIFKFIIVIRFLFIYKHLNIKKFAILFVILLQLLFSIAKYIHTTKMESNSNF